MDVHQSTSPLGYVSILGETGEPTLGWKEGSGLYFLLLQEQLKGIIIRTTESTPFRQQTVSDTTENLAEAPPRSPAPVSTGGRSGVGRSSDGRNEHSRIVLPPETGEQPSLSSGLSDAPWFNRRRPGSLYSIIEIRILLLLPLGLLGRGGALTGTQGERRFWKHAESAF